MNLPLSLTSNTFDDVVSTTALPSALHSTNIDIFAVAQFCDMHIPTSTSSSTDTDPWTSHDIDFSAFTTTPIKSSQPTKQPGRIEQATTHPDLFAAHNVESQKATLGACKKQKFGPWGENGKVESRRMSRQRVQRSSKLPLLRQNKDVREKLLERNRVAASKCREKKKKWAHRLEERARVLACQRQVSINHIMLLRYQLLELKDKCLAHTNCECEQIRQYLRAQYLESTQRRAWHIKPQLSAFQKPCQTPRRLFLLLLLLPTPIRHIWMIRGCFYKVRIRFHTRICEF
jgi:hypothetical protein